FAAINTGNNLLFLGWGLVLSSIVISGVLSEGTLRPLKLSVKTPAEARVDRTTAFGVAIENQANRSIFAIEVSIALDGPRGGESAYTPYLLRMPPGDEQQVLARVVPEHRGAYRIRQADATTRFPFGFFIKTRPIRLPETTFWVMPKQVDVSELSRALVSRRGESSANRAGLGEDYFDLRAYRPGDDLRRVRWRRAARSRRLVVVETEAMAGQEVSLELYLPALADGDADTIEHAIAVTGSVAEELLNRGLRVGLRIPGASLPPRGDDRQRMEILLALARLDVTGSPVLDSTPLPGARIAVTAPGAAAPDYADLHLDPEQVSRGAA
ncbi:MAG: DUF58 domain-containing protein, partial [Myxococcota bacterium]